MVVLTDFKNIFFLFISEVLVIFTSVRLSSLVMDVSLSHFLNELLNSDGLFRIELTESKVHQAQQKLRR